MRICSHRGFWHAPHEKNSLAAFDRSFHAGFGAEIDVRDAAGRLVISHDVPTRHELHLSLDEVLESHRRFAPDSCLALNVKADGLQSLLGDMLREFGVRDYFTFDMSIPDMLGYASGGLRFFTRHSDVEVQPVLYSKASGVWVDSLFSDWVTEDVLAAHFSAGKEIALVSPELHHRDHLPFWHFVRSLRLVPHDALLLCTDFPDAAREFFHG
jgi:glycerophosphoryl diester phosphodiesterase